MKLILAVLLSQMVLWPLDLIAASEWDHSYKSFDQVLKTQLKIDGMKSSVDYPRLKRQPEELNRLLASLSAVSADDYNAFNANQKLAFLINAYNAFTLKLIIDHYPVASIRDIGSALKTGWKMEFFSLLGRKMSLDHIEHEMIRKDFEEPRIHFALVCAARSCPALRYEPFVPARLDSQLQDAATKFLSDPDRNRYDRKAGQLHLSSIFKWYGDDFIGKKKGKAGSLQAYVAPFMTNDRDLRVLIGSAETKVSYLDYDWSLNVVRK